MTVAARSDAYDNGAIAAALREAAALLAAQGANPFRVLAYRRAADTVDAAPGSLRERFEREGRAALDRLPGVGPGIAAAIAELLATGRWSQLEHLRGGGDPTDALRVVPGIGPRLARHIHDELGVETLEGLEVAAHDGRLAGVVGIGQRRARAIGAMVAEMLGRRPGGAVAAPVLPAHTIPVTALLDVDREYRERAQSNELKKIAPRRFNPRGVAWLPVLHTRRGPWHLTALYSNTARAHELGREHDWVVIYGIDGDHVERQHTVVTETRGPLAGRRVVRGREAECRSTLLDDRDSEAAPAASTPLASAGPFD